MVGTQWERQMLDLATYADELLNVTKDLHVMYIQQLAIAQATIKTLQKEVEELQKQIHQQDSV